MRSQKFRRYKGRVFYRSRRRWLWALLILVLVFLLLRAIFRALFGRRKK